MFTKRYESLKMRHTISQNKSNQNFHEMIRWGLDRLRNDISDGLSIRNEAEKKRIANIKGGKSSSRQFGFKHLHYILPTLFAYVYNSS